MNPGILEKIKIVLVGTTHPGNIGASARAMKTMGISTLALVRPRSFPSADATARAAGADDILTRATLHEGLHAAVRDCVYVTGTTARNRTIPWPVIDPQQAASEIIRYAAQGKTVAVVFGRESTGLTNQELENCNTVVAIPTNPDYSSLNIAAAVQVITYEVRRAALHFLPAGDDPEPIIPLVSNEEMQKFYEHLEQCLVDLKFHDPDKPRQLMRRLRRLFNRSQLDENEYNILRGILAAAQDAAGQSGKS